MTVHNLIDDKQRALTKENCLDVPRTGNQTLLAQRGIGIGAENNDPTKSALVEPPPVTATQRLQNLVKGCVAELGWEIHDHRTSLETYGIGTFYGSNSSFAGPVTLKDHPREVEKTAQRKTIETKLEKRFGKEEAQEILGRLKETNCSQLLVDVLRVGFKYAGLESDWTIIEAKVKSSRKWEQGGGKASVLLEELRIRGWKTRYWNTDLARQDGGYTYSQVIDRLKVPPKAKQDAVTVGAIWLAPDLSPAILRDKVPFAVGFVDTGWHGFVQVGYTVYESHWDSGPFDPNIISVRPFSALPSFHGVIAIPYL